MKIRFGSREEMVTGTGLIGGGEASLTFKTSINAAPRLMIVSENAGRVLSGLDVTDSVRGGKLWLTNIFKGDNFRSYDTTIELANFRVVEAPRALRAFSVLSLAGLYSLVEGDGTAFRRGNAVLETRGPTVKISSIRAGGEAVGVTMLGVFDRITKKVDVIGNLVPVNQISKIIGGLPVVGDLITGIDKSGIFVTQFKVTGTSDDMKMSVNPVTSIAPGLIRDLFSPNWLGNEEQRLFGADNAKSKASRNKQKVKAVD
ncbi:MAG: AsmA-like C-terminal domain-containing protein [Candidatus Puniceispirillaceae bacterium]